MCTSMKFCFYFSFVFFPVTQSTNTRLFIALVSFRDVKNEIIIHRGCPEMSSANGVGGWVQEMLRAC